MNYNWLACVGVLLSLLNSTEDIFLKDQPIVFHAGSGSIMILIAHSPIGN